MNLIGHSINILNIPKFYIKSSVFSPLSFISLAFYSCSSTLAALSFINSSYASLNFFLSSSPRSKLFTSDIHELYTIGIAI